MSSPDDKFNNTARHTLQTYTFLQRATSAFAPSSQLRRGLQRGQWLPPRAPAAVAAALWLAGRRRWPTLPSRALLPRCTRRVATAAPPHPASARGSELTLTAASRCCVRPSLPAGWLLSWSRAVQRHLWQRHLYRRWWRRVTTTPLRWTVHDDAEGGRLG